MFQLAIAICDLFIILLNIMNLQEGWNNYDKKIEKSFKFHIIHINIY